MAAAIHRVGKVYMREDGMTVVTGWHVGPAVDAPPPPIIEWTEEHQRDWMRYLAEQAQAVAEGMLEPPNPETEIFDGWTLGALAELSVTLGEGATLDR